MRKKWKYYENDNKEEAIKLEEKFNVNKLLAMIMANRGITEKNAEIFL